MANLYDCGKCPAYCCSYDRIAITKRDVNRLAKHFGIEPEVATRRFTKVVEGDVVAQTEQVLRNLDAVLASAGATWADVVKTTVFLTDMRDFPRMNEVYARAMGDARPARSTVQVSGLPRGVLVEIDLIAALPASS